MCGIAGLFQPGGGPIAAADVRRMVDVIPHRGPDGGGVYTDTCAGLGHRRLSIIDLSEAARQPMAGEDGNVVLTFNGEIYNYVQLRAELRSLGHRFVSDTDSEVIVHGYEAWGDAVVDRLNGMFAFGIWDEGRRRLLLARDRFGVKPLYWHWDGTRLAFGSEIKSILACGIRRDVDVVALDEYFSFQNVFSDRTLFDGVRLLPPGTVLTLESGPTTRPVLRTYWDYPFGQPTLDIDPHEAAEELHRLFLRAVTRQLVADVPVGAYLSGGIDSSAIAAVAGRHLPRLRTFTAGFDLSSASGLELGFDERRAAETLSNLLKSEHYEVVLHAGDMEAVLPDLVWHLEDLRVGQSYPNYYVARLASKFVRVVLSGAGGDELFAGYPWRYYRGVGSSGPADFLERYYGFWQRLVPDGDKPLLFNAETARRVAGASTFDRFRSVFDGFAPALDGPEAYLNASLYFELKTFLPGLLLMEDKLSMAHSLETRVPFLDNDLVDFAVRLPAAHKLSTIDLAARMDENSPGKRQRYELETSDGKRILRDAMARIVPSEVTARAKQGFSAPDASWFRGESIDYINRLLRDPRARMYEYLDPEYVTGVLDRHCSGRQNHRLLIWSLLSFEWWCRTFLDGDGGRSTQRQDRVLRLSVAREQSKRGRGRVRVVSTVGRKVA